MAVNTILPTVLEVMSRHMGDEEALEPSMWALANVYYCTAAETLFWDRAHAPSTHTRNTPHMHVCTHAHTHAVWCGVLYFASMLTVC